MLDLLKLEQQAREALEVAGKATEGPWRVGDIARPKCIAGPACKQQITAGPKRTVAQTFGGQWRRPRREGEVSNDVDWQGNPCPNSWYVRERIDDPDAVFIAHSRTAVPDLAQAVLDLAAELRQARNRAEIQEVD